MLDRVAERSPPLPHRRDPVSSPTAPRWEHELELCDVCGRQRNVGRTGAGCDVERPLSGWSGREVLSSRWQLASRRCLGCCSSSRVHRWRQAAAGSDRWHTTHVSPSAALARGRVPRPRTARAPIPARGCSGAVRRQVGCRQARLPALPGARANDVRGERQVVGGQPQQPDPKKEADHAAPGQRPHAERNAADRSQRELGENYAAAAAGAARAVHVKRGKSPNVEPPVSPTTLGTPNIPPGCGRMTTSLLHSPHQASRASRFTCKGLIFGCGIHVTEARSGP